jgi:hypothetical protein
VVAASGDQCVEDAFISMGGCAKYARADRRQSARRFLDSN